MRVFGHSSSHDSKLKQKSFQQALPSSSSKWNLFRFFRNKTSRPNDVCPPNMKHSSCQSPHSKFHEFSNPCELSSSPPYDLGIPFISSQKLFSDSKHWKPHSSVNISSTFLPPPRSSISPIYSQSSKDSGCPKSSPELNFQYPHSSPFSSRQHRLQRRSRQTIPENCCHESSSSVKVQESKTCQNVPNTETEFQTYKEPSYSSSSHYSSSSPSLDFRRSRDSDPGFSTKLRRSVFQSALSDLESVLKSIGSDESLLDRAERRDLPSAHQILLRQSSLSSFEYYEKDKEETSKSFSRLENRVRTPSIRRSGVLDKEKDDMYYRIVSTNNREIPTPYSYGSQSYLNSPTFKVSSSRSFEQIKKNQDYDDDYDEIENEPDTIIDDLHRRSFKDANRTSRLPDPQPKFGIPLGLPCPSSSSDYLHAIPQRGFRCTFRSSKTPDVVLDDLSFRTLRKDEKLHSPSDLGVIKDPCFQYYSNSKSTYSLYSLCQSAEKNEEGNEDEFLLGSEKPHLSKTPLMMSSSSRNIAEIIKKQSGRPSAYLKYPVIQALLENNDESKCLSESSLRKSWSGKTLYELLSSYESPESSECQEHVRIPSQNSTRSPKSKNQKIKDSEVSKSRQRRKYFAVHRVSCPIMSSSEEEEEKEKTKSNSESLLDFRIRVRSQSQSSSEVSKRVKRRRRKKKETPPSENSTKAFDDSNSESVRNSKSYQTYSSEDILLQAISSLQDLGEKDLGAGSFKSIHSSSFSSSSSCSLSSPELLKSLRPSLTPPISRTFHTSDIRGRKLGKPPIPFSSSPPSFSKMVSLRKVELSFRKKGFNPDESRPMSASYLHSTSKAEKELRRKSEACIRSESPIEFNEERVLKTCEDFLKNYESFRFPKPILKKSFEPSVNFEINSLHHSNNNNSEEFHSILKPKNNEDENRKKFDFESVENENEGNFEDNDFPGILKSRKSSFGSLESYPEDIQLSSILKKGSFFEEDLCEFKSILKKKSEKVTDDEKDDEESLKSILKIFKTSDDESFRTTDNKSNFEKPILKTQDFFKRRASFGAESSGNKEFSPFGHSRPHSLGSRETILEDFSNWSLFKRVDNTEVKEETPRRASSLRSFRSSMSDNIDIDVVGRPPVLKRERSASLCKGFKSHVLTVDEVQNASFATKMKLGLYKKDDVSSFSTPTSSSGGILKRRSRGHVENFDVIESPLRGVLKKDSSYDEDEPLKPILKAIGVSETQTHETFFKTSEEEGNSSICRRTSNILLSQREDTKSKSFEIVGERLTEPRTHISLVNQSQRSFLSSSSSLPSAEKFYQIYKESKKKNTSSPNNNINNKYNDLEVQMKELQGVKKEGNGVKKNIEFRDGGSVIAERLAALAQTEENWKKRLRKIGDSSESDNSSSSRSSNSSPSLSGILSLLQESQKSWVDKVERGQKDARQFTVAGKLLESPSSKSFLRLENKNNNNLKVKSLGILRPHSCLIDALLPVSKKEDTSEFCQKECSDFFSSLKESPLKDLELSDLNSIVRNQTVLSLPKRASKPRNKKSAQSGQSTTNDLNKSKLRSEPIVEDVPSISKCTSQVHSHLASEALAALASKEDFTSISLKKGGRLLSEIEDFLPYKSLMLLQIKGRRACSTRLISPTFKSLNSGDCFILLSSSEIFSYFGRYSNVIERSRCSEVSASILQYRDLGFRSSLSGSVISIEEPNFHSRFFSLLGFEATETSPVIAPSSHSKEDEDYEIQVNQFNVFYELSKSTGLFVQNLEASGKIPHYSLLQSSQVLLLDFGSEVYVWNGKGASAEERKAGLRAGVKYFEAGYDYRAIGEIHPTYTTDDSLSSSPLLTSSSRPNWSLFGKVNSNMETILFKEKFADWPQDKTYDKCRSQEIEDKRICKGLGSLIPSSSVKTIQAFDASTLLSFPILEPDLILENTHLGRGHGSYDPEERRTVEVETMEVAVWIIHENEALPLTFDSNFVLTSQDSYIIKWNYRVSFSVKDLKGQPSKHVSAGRERFVYFFWQGKNSKATQKGVSALSTVFLDIERGPQIRVDENYEPSAFLNLWKGSLCIVTGHLLPLENKRLFDRLYILRGVEGNETHWKEVSWDPKSLRDFGSFFFSFNENPSLNFIWNGSHSSNSHLVNEASRNFSHLYSSFGNETGFSSFALNRTFPNFVWKTFSPPSMTPRLYHMTSVSGTFVVTEISCLHSKASVLYSMPFNQEDLYSAQQPALFLLDTGNKNWVWQGWWPETESGSDGYADGSVRWHAERRAALQTTIDTWKLVHGAETPFKGELIWGGFEPLEFKCLFHTWEKRLDVTERNARHVEINVNRTDIEITLAHLSRNEYSWNELISKPVPMGVDPSKLETYLNDKDFEEHLGLARNEFYNSPKWKQLEIRKEKGLF